MDALLPWLVIWIVIAAALYVGEMLAATFFMLPFAIGATGAAIGCALGLEVLWQWIVFVALSILALLATRPFARRVLAHAPKEKANADRLLGLTGSIIEQRAGIGEGRVKVDGDVWNVTSDDGSALVTGDRVEVLQIDGTHLIVKRI